MRFAYGRPDEGRCYTSFDRGNRNRRAGVNSLTRLETALHELMELGVRHVMIAFDMDFMINRHVQNGYQNLVWMLDGMGLTFGTYLWHSEYKGLDDYVWECLMENDFR